jgi:hypothetical protein
VSARTNSPPGGANRSIRPGMGMKPRAGSSALIRHSIATPRQPIPAWPQRKPLARGDPELLLHEVEPGDHLGDRVLHLNPAVHLHEVKVAVLVDQELERALLHLTKPRQARSVDPGLIRSPGPTRRRRPSPARSPVRRRRVRSGRDGTVALTEGNRLDRRLALRSESEGEFSEGREEPLPWIGIKAEFVVVAAEVLDEGVPSADYLP